jgi:gliding motility-associated-like protein
VYARWGEQVHYGYKANQLWDGTINGLPAVTDVYIYVLKYKLAGETEKTQKGEVSLIR